MEDGGVIVLIARDSDRGRIAQLLDGWRIEDQTDAPPEREGGPAMVLTRAVLTAPQNR